MTQQRRSYAFFYGGDATLYVTDAMLRVYKAQEMDIRIISPTLNNHTTTMKVNFKNTLIVRSLLDEHAWNCLFGRFCEVLGLIWNLLA